ncbi:MAG: hypothetical protein WD336_03785 [Trueperaceae bacterium]
MKILDRAGSALELYARIAAIVGPATASPVLASSGTPPSWAVM